MKYWIFISTVDISANLKNIDIDIDIDKEVLENIDIDKEVLENIDIHIDKEILENIDIDKILNWLEFGISNSPSGDLSQSVCLHHGVYVVMFKCRKGGGGQSLPTNISNRHKGDWFYSHHISTTCPY